MIMDVRLKEVVKELNNALNETQII